MTGHVVHPEATVRQWLAERDAARADAARLADCLRYFVEAADPDDYEEPVATADEALRTHDALAAREAGR